MDSGIVPTRTEASSTSPRIFHPLQAGKPASSAPSTSLRAYSTTVGMDESSGTAVLGASADTARTYVAGAILESGAVLAEIHPDHVVLELDGQRYTLYVAGADPRTTRPVEAAAANAALRLGGGPAVEHLPAAAIHLESVLRYTPARQGEEAAGLTLYPGTQGKFFEQWGLKRGDVLVSLGDVSGNNIEGLTEQLGRLTKGQSLLARVRRGSEEFQVLLDASGLRQVN
jgi:type II secretion system protein C